MCLVSAAVTLLTALPLMGQTRWFKGNTHTHTWWSDGDAPTEIAAKWYRDHRYHFLVITDHTTVPTKAKWITPKGRQEEALTIFNKTNAMEHVPKREQNGQVEYQIRPLSEIRPLFEKTDEFLLIEGEEISEHYEKRPIHVNALNVQNQIELQKGGGVTEVIQNDVNAVQAQREKTRQPMITQINHPNFGWALTAEDIASVKGCRLLEVYNGHPGVRNAGDATHPSCEEIWDIVLALRLGELKLPVIYGVADDDAHNFSKFNDKSANPGRGWVYVHAKTLAPTDIIEAMERGDFYASSGVVLKEISFSSNTLTIEIEPKDGVTYKTQFIGTPKKFDRTSKPRTEDPKAAITRKYSSEIGKIYAEKTGTKVSYTLTGDELYIRAKVISTAKPANPTPENQYEAAWVQPVQPK